MVGTTTASARVLRAKAVAGHVLATALVIFFGGEAVRPAVGGDLTQGDGFVWATGMIVLNSVVALVLLARRRRPAAVLAVVTALVVLSVPLDVFNWGLALAAAIAAYSLVLALGRPRTWHWGAGATLVVCCAALAAGEPVVPYALVVLLGGALGDSVRSWREHLAAVTERAERAEATREAIARRRVAEARLSIARDLHDVVGHQIAVINLHAGAASAALGSRPEDAARSLEIIRRSSRDVITEIGNLMAALRDPDAADGGPAGLARLDDVVRDFAVHGLTVTTRTEGQARELPGAVDATALRVVQEALTNAHKHGASGGAGTQHAHLLVEYLPEALRLTVTNPLGDGSAPLSVGTGHGLVGMAERVESVRGTLTAGDDGRGGWQVVVTLPTAGGPW